MLNFFNTLIARQAAIAVVSARERHLTALLVAVWGGIGRIRKGLERLIALWRAGLLPKPRAPGTKRTGTPRGKIIPEFPTVPAWLVVAVRAAAPLGAQLEHLLSQEEYVAFLAACPQARRLLRPLCRMLGVGAVRKARKPRAVWVAPKAAPVVVQAGLVVGPGGRLLWV